MESKRVGNEQLEITHCFFFQHYFFISGNWSLIPHRGQPSSYNVCPLVSPKSSEYFICKLAGTTYGLSFPRVLGKCYFWGNYGGGANRRCGYNLGRWLSGKSSCCTSITIWVQNPRTHVSLLAFLFLWPKITWRRKVLFLFTGYNPSLRETKAGTQGRILEAGAEAEAVK